MFYLIALAEKQNQKFWLYADKKLSGELDWRLVASANYDQLRGRVFDFVFDHTFRWDDPLPCANSANIICTLWELNPVMDLDELRSTCNAIRAYTGCRCLIVPDDLIIGFLDLMEIWAEELDKGMKKLSDLGGSGSTP